MRAACPPHAFSVTHAACNSKYLMKNLDFKIKALFFGTIHAEYILGA
jgi:hypothetical protein